MSDLVGYAFVILLSIIFFAFPGMFITQWLKNFNNFSKVIATVFLSLGFWICISWYISILGLPLNYTVYTLHLVFMFLFFRGKYYKNFKLNNFDITKIPPHYLVLCCIILYEFYPLFSLTIAPGGDTTMHGYITRLIINNNGLPDSYRPILPVDYFGSYSAGYHILTALMSGMSLIFLRFAINFFSIATYPILLLGFIFLLKNFFSERNSIYTAIIFYAINTSYLSTIYWGGNSTILSVAFCFFSTGMIINGIFNKQREILLLAAITIASVFLVHLIPGIAFVYIALLGYAILVIKYRNNLKWILLNTSLLLLAIFVLLFPFIINFKYQNIPELTIMIKDWQHQMMRNNLTGVFSTDMIVTIQEIYYRIGGAITILSCISLLFVIFYKKFFSLAIIFSFIVLLYIIIINSGYWFLPVSELLYPERIVLFVIPIWSCLFGFFITKIEEKFPNIVIVHIEIVKRKISFYALILVTFLCLCFSNINEVNNVLSHDERMVCNKLARDSFDWINENTEKNAIFEVNYGYTGMWIPTFTNRATYGTHVHFLHVCQKVLDSLKSSNYPRYYFVSKSELKLNKNINKTISTKQKVFCNEEVEIYK